MPAKNVVKFYSENAYFHTSNRGVEKRRIFIEEQDCSVFLHYLKLYLSPVDEIENEATFGSIKTRFLNLNLEKEVELLAFSLMPNHYHMLLKQHTVDGITKLLKRVSTAYVMYFNKKYNRVGPLFQGIFKACPVLTDEYLLYLTRYIHLNPTKIHDKINFDNFSSFPNYCGQRNASWVKPGEILSFFNIENKSKQFSYRNFVLGNDKDEPIIDTSLFLEDSCLS